MRRWIEDLLALQALDLRIRNLEIKLKTIPGERAKLVAEFEVVKKALQEAKANQQKVELDIRKVEADNAAANEAMRKLQTHSATVKKNTEYQAMLAEIETIKKRISDLESVEIGLWDILEDAKKKVRQAERNYNSTGRAVQGELKEFETLKVQINDEIGRTNSRIAQTEKGIEQEILSVYKRLLSSGKGEPLSAIRQGGMCTNCNLKLTPQTLNQASKGVLTLCDNCSHMLYDPDSKAQD